MLAGGNLVRQFLVASHRRDTLLDLTGEGSLFPATLTRQMRPVVITKPDSASQLRARLERQDRLESCQEGEGEGERKDSCYLHCIACK
jgi:hypothetical protein